MDWLANLDTSLQHSGRFFAGQPVALDLSAVNLSPNAIGQLVTNLEERNIRILGIEGIDPAKWQAGLPFVLHSGRGLRLSELPGAAAPVASTPATALAPQKRVPASLVIEDPVRSGQSVVFLEGDVTVLGSVGSGAEIVAGGSIHVYGALRGRARAGATGHTGARIFCRRAEAELLSITSNYLTADEIEDSLRQQPAQAWLDGDTLRIATMN